MTHLGTITLETERLILRRLCLADAPVMFANWASDPDVTKYLTWLTHESVAVTEGVLTDWVNRYEQADFYNWGLELKESGMLIGSMGIVKLDERTNNVHFGYCIGKQWWGQGLTTEALRRLVSFFFEDVGMERLEARHDPNNPASGAVMQKAGLNYEGTFIARDYNNQGICDTAYYAILARDYFREKTPGKDVTLTYRRATIADLAVVTGLLHELYEMDREELRAENIRMFADERQCFFLAYVGDALKGERAIAIAHVAIRHDHVNGMEADGPCAYLEAIYVKPEYRYHGVARELVGICEAWAGEQGLREFLSDCLLHNTDSYLFHRRLGFTETERCIFFRKEVGQEC